MSESEIVQEPKPVLNVPLNSTRLTNLVDNIRRGRVALFLGAGACFPHIPTGKKVIEKWLSNASDYLVPELAWQLPHVAQHRRLSLRNSAIAVKDDFIEDFINGRGNEVDYRAGTDPLGVLAQLPFDIVVTTNYDDLMLRAFEAWGKKPQLAICQWNNGDAPEKRFKEIEHQNGLSENVSPNEPVIFHLHGHHSDAKSLVLLEEDYEHFLARMWKPPQGRDETQDVLPAFIQTAVAHRSLLFIGYSLQDMTFRSIFRGLLSSVDRNNSMPGVTVQYSESISRSQAKYTKKYFQSFDIDYVNQTAKQFTTALLKRWKKASGGKNVP